MKKVGIIGATGYAGAELLRLLQAHALVEVAAVSSTSYEGQEVSGLYPNLRGVYESILTDENGVLETSDIVFAALPHGLSEPLARRCMDRGALFIDLGADFRLENEDDYRTWYGLEYKEKALHEKAVYCIPELHRTAMVGKQIVANPGCYPTSVALGLAPALQSGLIETAGIVIDSKSGATGAGRGLALNTHFTECNEAFAPYKIASHRHTPEIEQTLSALAGERMCVTFVPHLLPVNRGIVSTMYAMLSGPAELEAIYEAYCAFYRGEKFVRVRPLGEIASLKYVKYSNYCDISLHLDARAGRLIVVTAIDNMVKGAAGQAIQNMNLLCGFPEDTGLQMVPPAF